MLMLIMVLDNAIHLNSVLQAWRGAGVRGVTILESTGINRVMTREEADVAFAGFSQIFGSRRVGHNTLFAVIDSLETAQAAVTATEQVVGDLNEPSTGIIFTVPVVQAWGVTNDAPGS